MAGRTGEYAKAPKGGSWFVGYRFAREGMDFKVAWFHFVEYWSEQAEIRDKREANRREDLTPADLPEDIWT